MNRKNPNYFSEKLKKVMDLKNLIKTFRMVIFLNKQGKHVVRSL